MNFNELKLDAKLLEAISYMGYENATPIQEKVIPLILEKCDLIACSQTGTGKTAAFVLPILNSLTNHNENTIDTLIIVPTRELAIQIEQQIQGFSYFVSASSIAVYGGGDGNDWEVQKKALTQGADIVVATPGKLLSYIKMECVNFKNLKHLVLDEADRMLDMGFIDDINAIISYLPKNRQTLMFSATMPKSIRQLARKILNKPKEVAMSMSKPAEGVDQKVCILNEVDKDKTISLLLREREVFDSILIFTSTKSKVSEIARSLNKSGFPAHGISSNLEQDKREEVLQDFRSKKIRILVATDVMSRGIDIKEINLVINYDVPHEVEDYVHRVGRTARVNAKGEAITFVTKKEMEKLKRIEQVIDRKIPIITFTNSKIKPPEKTEKVRQGKFVVKKRIND